MKQKFSRALRLMTLTLLMNALALGASAGAISQNVVSPAPTVEAAPTAEPVPQAVDVPAETPVPAPTFMSEAAHSAVFTDSSTAVPAADIDLSSITDDGVIRVYLKSLSDPATLTLTLDGDYCVDGSGDFLLARGTTLALAAGDGKIYLSSGGLTINMGAGLSLTRQASGSETNGLYIAESEKGNLYCGDLRVTPAEGGGLQAVLSINIEDYLLGVIAYEMSDSWPLEALKAQAVAARTYAMQRKWNAGSRDYDLVDTTADQVYKGYNPEYLNVRQAVAETAGVVGTYKGGFATCYYTASNGGQTALATDIWQSEGDYGYLSMQDDPYDLENPNSMVSSLTISPDCAESSSLKALLEAGLIEAAEAQGMDTSTLQFESIRSIEAIEPEFEGSYMYTKLRFTLTASAMQTVYLPPEDDTGAPGAATGDASADAVLSGVDLVRRLLLNAPYTAGSERRALEDGFTVDLTVYDQIKKGLDLGINGGNYELVSVVTGDTGFTIEMRRFGHGVGMSQRGAQWMAGQYDKLYTDILAFYYPGLTLERIEWDTPELAAAEALPEGVSFVRTEPTATPTPAPLPEPGEGEYYATVTLGDTSSTLNMRAEPNTTAKVVDKLANGRQLIVSGAADGNGWVAVRTAELSGYVKLEYLQAD